MNPENLEPSNEKQEKAKKIEKLLNPDLDNAITLYKEIDENIYFGAKEYEDRALRVEACGYDAKTLSHIGKSAKTEMRDMHEDSSGRPMSPTQKAEFDLLRSITLSQIGPKGESFGYHSELSVGLASGLVRQMKKAALFIQEPDSDEKTIKKIFGSRGLNLVDEKDAENIITISKEKILLVKDIWESDKLKISALNNLGYDVLIIWENDINNNKEVELNKCINFIKNNKI